MANMFEIRVDIENSSGVPSYVKVIGPVDMDDHEIMRFVALSIVSRRFKGKDKQLNSMEFAERLVNASVLLTNTETHIQEELRTDFKLFAAIDATILNLQSQMADTLTPKTSGFSKFMAVVMSIVGLAGAGLIFSGVMLMLVALGKLAAAVLNS